MLTLPCRVCCILRFGFGDIIVGGPRGCTVKVGSFTARISLTAVKMKEYDLMIGLRDHPIAIVPFSNALFVLGSHPCMIRASSGTSRGGNLSAVQNTNGQERRESGHLACLHWVSEESSGAMI